MVEALLGEAQDGDLKSVIRNRATRDEDEPDRPLRACISLIDPNASLYMASEAESMEATGEVSISGTDGPASGAGSLGPRKTWCRSVAEEPQSFAVGGKPGRLLPSHPSLLAQLSEVLTLLTEEKQLGPNVADPHLSKTFRAVWHSGQVKLPPSCTMH